MEKINITFLGTSDSLPTKNRNHTSILLSYKSENILVDCGEGTQRQLKKANLSPLKITKILITHWHGDHILGLPGLFQTLALLGYSKMLQIYGPKGTKKFISEIMKMFIFVDRIKYQVHEVSNSTIINEIDYKIEAFPLKHTKYSNGYAFIENEKLRIDKKKLAKLKLPHSPLLKKLTQGKDIIIKNKKIKSSSLTYKQDGRKVSFIFDTAFENSIISKVKNSNLIISESTYMKNDSALARKHNHLTSTQAAQIAKKSKSKSLILTHIAGRYEHKFSDILKEVKNIFKQSSIAKDLDSISL
jgi:ribonuclease Z